MGERPDEQEDVCDPGRSDLYQEGAIALCKAAATYDGSSAQFGTYATTVIRNHFLNHCKTVNAGHRNLPAVSLDAGDSDEDGPPKFLDPFTPDGVDELIGRLDAAQHNLAGQAGLNDGLGQFLHTQGIDVTLNSSPNRLIFLTAQAGTQYIDF